MAATPTASDAHRPTMYRALVYGLQGLFVASAPDSIRSTAIQVPVLDIQAPTPEQRLASPSSVTLEWDTEFVRFDRAPYPACAEADMNLAYVVTYRAEGTEQWLHATDGTPAEPGFWPEDGSQALPDSGSGVESYEVTTSSSSFPAGRYEFRIDAVNEGSELHCASHTVIVEISR